MGLRVPVCPQKARRGADDTVAGVNAEPGTTGGPSPCATFSRSAADASPAANRFVSDSSASTAARGRSVMRSGPVFALSLFTFAGVCGLGVRPAAAQERAYFVTYDHYLEERGNLEIAVADTSGLPR